jgi:DNA repair protein RecO (recombination protein O)
VPSVTDEAVCIRHWDFSETSQTVSLFCREQGILRGLAKGAKRAGGRFSGGIDLLTCGQVVAIVKGGRELATLTDWTLLRAYRSLRHDLEANRSAYYLADLVGRLFAPADPHPRLYDALVTGLEALETPGTAAAVVLRFQWFSLVESGQQPQLEVPAGHGATLSFIPGQARFTSDPPGNLAAWKVRRTTVELLEEVAADPSIALIARLSAADPESVRRANRFLAAYLRDSMQAEPFSMRALFADRAV